MAKGLRTASGAGRTFLPSPGVFREEEDKYGGQEGGGHACPRSHNSSKGLLLIF